MRFWLTLTSILFLSLSANAAEVIPHDLPECHTLDFEVESIIAGSTGVSVLKIDEEKGYALLKSTEADQILYVQTDLKTKCTSFWVVLTPNEYELQFGTGV